MTVDTFISEARRLTPKVAESDTLTLFELCELEEAIYALDVQFSAFGRKEQRQIMAALRIPLFERWKIFRALKKAG